MKTDENSENISRVNQLLFIIIIFGFAAFGIGAMSLFKKRHSFYQRQRGGCPAALCLAPLLLL